MIAMMPRIALILLVLFAAGCGEQSPAVVRGRADLALWLLGARGPAALDGQWELYWGRLLAPGDFGKTPGPIPDGFVTVPGTWEGQKPAGAALPHQGHATLRARLVLDREYPMLALMAGDMNSAYRLYVNGVLLAQGGTPGTSLASSIPGWTRNVVRFGPAREVEIILQVSNYHSFRGGPQRSIVLGLDEDIQGRRDRRLTLDLFLSGMILIMGLYHLGLHAHRRRERDCLYFGIFCLTVALYILSIGRMNFSMPVSGRWWEAWMKLSYLPIFTGTPLFAVFVRTLFPADLHRFIVRTLWIISAPFIVAALVLPARWYVPGLPLYHGIMLATAAIIGYTMVRALRYRRDEALLFMMGIAGLFVCIINDILLYEGLTATVDVAAFGMVFLIFSESVLLARRSARADRLIESLSRDKRELLHILHERDETDEEVTITPATEEKMKKAIAYITDNYRSEISREGLALSLGMHPDNFGRLFKIYTGKKAGELVNDLRTREAAELLANTDRSVIDIALDVGYENLRTFNRAFKKLQAMPPMDYRKRHRNLPHLQ